MYTAGVISFTRGIVTSKLTNQKLTVKISMKAEKEGMICLHYSHEKIHGFQMFSDAIYLHQMKDMGLIYWWTKPIITLAASLHVSKHLKEVDLDQPYTANPTHISLDAILTNQEYAVLHSPWKNSQHQ